MLLPHCVRGIHLSASGRLDVHFIIARGVEHQAEHLHKLDEDKKNFKNRDGINVSMGRKQESLIKQWISE